jgi:hypothetical protein
MRLLWCAVLAGFAAATPALAEQSGRPVVAELFTSEGCSSCPPADALAAELALSRPDLLLLTFHVTYWNHLGWQDPFSFAGATERQRRYVALGVASEVYTPALVVDGRQDVVGSDRSAVNAALLRATKDANAVPVSVVGQGGQATITVGAGHGRGTILLVGYDREHRTHVGLGENRGRTLLEVNIVRSMTEAGTWSGQPLTLRTSLPPGELSAVLLQADDGHIIGASRLTVARS